MRARAVGMTFRSAVPRNTRKIAVEHLGWIMMQEHADFTVQDKNVATWDGPVVGHDEVRAAQTNGDVLLLAQNTISLFFPSK